MGCVNFNKIKKALIIGPIYDQLDKLQKIKNMSENYDITIINGSICHILNNNQKNRIENFEKILNKKIYYLASDLDYVSMMEDDFIKNWLLDKPNVAKIKFNSGVPVLIMSGGIPSQLGRFGIESNLEISFVTNQGEVAWHHKYNGMAGYVISNNPLSDAPPEFFNYSARIGINYNKNKIYCQEIEEYGLKNTILL
jgi:hypothetical protein